MNVYLVHLVSIKTQMLMLSVSHVLTSAIQLSLLLAVSTNAKVRLFLRCFSVCDSVTLSFTYLL